MDHLYIHWLYEWIVRMYLYIYILLMCLYRLNKYTFDLLCICICIYWWYIDVDDISFEQKMILIHIQAGGFKHFWSFHPCGRFPMLTCPLFRCVGKTPPSRYIGYISAMTSSHEIWIFRIFHLDFRCPGMGRVIGWTIRINGRVSNYSDRKTRPGPPNGWFSKGKSMQPPSFQGNHGKSRLVKYYNLARWVVKFHLLFSHGPFLGLIRSAKPSAWISFRRWHWHCWWFASHGASATWRQGVGLLWGFQLGKWNHVGNPKVMQVFLFRFPWDFFGWFLRFYVNFFNAEPPSNLCNQKPQLKKLPPTRQKKPP